MLLGTQLKDGVVMSIVSDSDYPVFMYFCYILKSDSKSAIIYMNKVGSLCEANIILASQPWTTFSSAPSVCLNLGVFDAFVLDLETKHKCNKIAMGLTKSTVSVTNITPHLLSPSVCGGGRGRPLPQVSRSPIWKLICKGAPAWQPLSPELQSPACHLKVNFDQFNKEKGENTLLAPNLHGIGEGAKETDVRCPHDADDGADSLTLAGDIGQQ